MERYTIRDAKLKAMQENPSDENDILKGILAGRYRDCFLVYSRKSTDEPSNQKNSIKYQRAENTRFAQREKLCVAPITLPGFCLNGIISERHSGFKESDDVSITGSGMVQYRIERPKFHRLVQFLSKRSFRGVIVLCWDRLSRNRGDDTVVRKLMKAGIEVRFVYANYDNSSAGALHMDIDGMFAEHYSRVISEKVRLANRNLREQGICIYKAPLGYLNQGTAECKPFDPIRAPIIKRMFEILATEEWSLSDLTRWANEQGLTCWPTRPRRTPDQMLAEEDEDLKGDPVSRPMTVSRIHKLVTNPFYTGKVRGNDGKFVPSRSHEPLISEELFSKVQQTLAGKRVSVHYAQKLDLPGRGLVRCADCQRTYTPYVKKGIQYFNARCCAQCPNTRKNFGASFLADEIGKAIGRLSFTDDELGQIDAYIRSNSPAQEDKRRSLLEERDRRRKRIREDLAYLQESRLALLKAEVYSPESLKAEENRLAADLDQLMKAESESSASPQETLLETVKLSELLKYGSNYYHNGDFREKERFAGIIFSELLFSKNTLVCRAKNGFRALETRFWSVGGQTDQLSEALQYDKLVKSSIAALEQLLCDQKTNGP